MKKKIREIIEKHIYILMSCISSLLMIDHCVLSSPQWCIRGNTVVFYWSSWKKTLGVTLLFFIGRDEKNIRGNTVDIYQIKHRWWRCCFSWVVMNINIRGNTVVFYRSSWKKNIRGNTVVFVKLNIRGNTGVFYHSSWKKHKG